MNLNLHRTLKYLFEAREKQLSVPVDSIPHRILGFNKPKRIRVIEQLVSNNEIKFYSNKDKAPVEITSNGRLSYAKKKYIKLFWETSSNNWLKIVQIVVPIGLLFTAIISVLTIRESNIEQRQVIKRLQKQLDKAKSEASSQVKILQPKQKEIVDTLK